MKIVFYHAMKAREQMLAQALAQGAALLGDTLEMRHTGDYGEDGQENDLKYPGPTPDTDVAACFGVKGRSRIILDDHLLVGKSTLFFDKGYSRTKGEGGHTEYSRISVNASDPTLYMMERKRNDERFRKLNVRLEPRQRSGSGHILICGSSEKYHNFHRLPHPSEYASGLISRIKKMTDRQIVYRPKPSSKLPPVSGASYSPRQQNIADALRGAHCLVTHGSAAAMDAVFMGVPAIVLGRGIATPVSSNMLEHVEKPLWPDDELRKKWACALAWCQWTTPELRDGSAWKELRAEIERQRK